MRNFSQANFLRELQHNLHDFRCIDTNISFDEIIYIFTKLLDKHAPIKHKKVCENQNRFMNSVLSKAMMKRSSLKTKYFKNKTVSNRANYKKQRNVCLKLRDEAIKHDFSNCVSNLNKNSKPFYDLLKPYLTNKGAMCCTDINLIEGRKIISDEKN